MLFNLVSGISPTPSITTKKLVQDIKRLNLPLLQAELQIEAQAEDIGMCGSGNFTCKLSFWNRNKNRRNNE